jgi:hypothetical protein
MTNDAARERDEGAAARRAEAYAAEGAVGAMEAMRLNAVGMQQRLDDSEQRADKFQRELARRDGTATSLAHPSTLDGGVISGIGTIAKVYHALKLVKGKQGVDFQRKYNIDTSFQKDIADLSDRRTRTLLASLDPAMMTVLGAFHPDREEVLQLFAAHKRCSSSSAPRQLTFDQYAEIPIVKEAVESYKLATNAAERQQILSTMTSMFTLEKLNTLKFDKVVPRRQFHDARAHAAVWGAGRLAPSQAVHRARVKVTHFEAALRIISDPDNTQQDAFGTKVGRSRVVGIKTRVESVRP